MGLLNRFSRGAKGKQLLTKAVDQHGAKIADGIDKAATAADQRTGGKHQDKIRKATGQAKDGLDRLDGRRDDDLGTGRP